MNPISLNPKIKGKLLILEDIVVSKYSLNYIPSVPQYSIMLLLEPGTTELHST